MIDSGRRIGFILSLVSTKSPVRSLPLEQCLVSSWKRKTRSCKEGTGHLTTRAPEARCGADDYSKCSSFGQLRNLTTVADPDSASQIRTWWDIHQRQRFPTGSCSSEKRGVMESSTRNLQRRRRRKLSSSPFQEHSIHPRPARSSPAAQRRPRAARTRSSPTCCLSPQTLLAAPAQ